jgi:hypothetical protein
LGRGRVDSRCHLPARRAVSDLAHKHNLFSGGDWCASDYGHFEAGGSTACGQRSGGRREKHRHRYAMHHRNARAGGEASYAYQ